MTALICLRRTEGRHGRQIPLGGGGGGGAGLAGAVGGGDGAVGAGFGAAMTSLTVARSMSMEAFM